MAMGTSRWFWRWVLWVSLVGGNGCYVSLHALDKILGRFVISFLNSYSSNLYTSTIPMKSVCYKDPNHSSQIHLPNLSNCPAIHYLLLHPVHMPVVKTKDVNVHHIKWIHIVHNAVSPETVCNAKEIVYFQKHPQPIWSSHCSLCFSLKQVVVEHGKKHFKMQWPTLDKP